MYYLFLLEKSDIIENNILKYIDYQEYIDIKNTLDLYDKSKKLVTMLFKDKVDKNNESYMGHLLRVSNKMKTIEGKTAGLLHDVVEDIAGVTFNDLVDIGIPDNIIESLKLVTKKENKFSLTKEEKLELYNQEIVNIINSNNVLAIELKYCDMCDNYNLDRLKKLDKETQDWFKLKYDENINKLKEAKEKIK